MHEVDGTNKDRYFVGGRATALEDYQIVGLPQAPYTTFASAAEARDALLGPPSNYFQATVFSMGGAVLERD